MRTHGYWMVPFSPWVSTVSAAIRLAHVGVPLAAVALPAIPSFATSPSWAGKGEAAKGEGEAKDLQAASRWAAAVLSQLESHAQAAANKSLPMTMAVGLDACRLPASDSMLRFAAYASVLWGAQALWWEGIGACAPLESPEFALIGAVNARLAQCARSSCSPSYEVLGVAGLLDVVVVVAATSGPRSLAAGNVALRSHPTHGC